jgi:3-phenylpropionate/trans-cinnamate dioxygenase ferredoxin component
MSDFLAVAKRGDIPPGSVRVVTVGGQRVALCHAADGQFYAVEDRCSHDNAPLGQGPLEGDEIECPRHGARFDVRSGEVTCLPAVKAIKTYRVRVQGDDVEVALEAPHG